MIILYNIYFIAYNKYFLYINFFIFYIKNLKKFNFFYKKDNKKSLKFKFFNFI